MTEKNTKIFQNITYLKKKKLNVEGSFKPQKTKKFLILNYKYKKFQTSLTLTNYDKKVYKRAKISDIFVKILL